jgi:hypothetical protein
LQIVPATKYVVMFYIYSSSIVQVLSHVLYIVWTRYVVMFYIYSSSIVQVLSHVLYIVWPPGT